MKLIVNPVLTRIFSHTHTRGSKRSMAMEEISFNDLPIVFVKTIVSVRLSLSRHLLGLFSLMS